MADPKYILTHTGSEIDNILSDAETHITNADKHITSDERTKLAGIAAGANKTIVDSALSSTSTNPVQNKIINTAISNLNNLVGGTSVSTQINNAISGKADKPTVVTGTLSAGSTSITLTNSAITTDSVIDVYTSVYGVNPTNISVSNGSIALAFDAETSAVEIRIEVR